MSYLLIRFSKTKLKLVLAFRLGLLKKRPKDSRAYGALENL